jgi:hypothetical protein
VFNLRRIEHKDTKGTKAPLGRDPRGRDVVLAFALGSTLWLSSAAGHQAPDLDVNNRYLKVTLLPEKARIVHTVLFGERPGAAERRRMDTSGDGVLDPAERAAYGARALAELAPTVTAGGARATGWRVADVGVGEPRAAGGSFAVDLVLDLPYPDPRAAEQRLTIDDGAALPLAGEAEVRVDESPGVRVLASHLSSAGAGIELRYAFQGNATAPGDREITVRFAVDEELRPRARRWPWLAAGAAAAVVLGLAAARAARRQRKV